MSASGPSGPLVYALSQDKNMVLIIKRTHGSFGYVPVFDEK